MPPCHFDTFDKTQDKLREKSILNFTLDRGFG